MIKLCHFSRPIGIAAGYGGFRLYLVSKICDELLSVISVNKFIETVSY